MTTPLTFAEAMMLPLVELSQDPTTREACRRIERVLQGAIRVGRWRPNGGPTGYEDREVVQPDPAAPIRVGQVAPYLTFEAVAGFGDLGLPSMERLQTVQTALHLRRVPMIVERFARFSLPRMSLEVSPDVYAPLRLAVDLSRCWSRDSASVLADWCEEHRLQWTAIQLRFGPTPETHEGIVDLARNLGAEFSGPWSPATSDEIPTIQERIDLARIYAIVNTQRHHLHTHTNPDHTGVESSAHATRHAHDVVRLQLWCAHGARLECPPPEEDEGHAGSQACALCGGTGVVETGNNDLPCDCPAGATAEFNDATLGRVTGAELRAWDLHRRWSRS